MRKYETILNNMITLRAKEELIKTESFGSQKYDADNFAMHRKFRYIAKFCYHSEISLCSENSAYSKNFAMIAKISLCENFAIIANFLLSLRKFRYAYEIAILPLLASCIFQPVISSSQA